MESRRAVIWETVETRVYAIVLYGNDDLKMFFGSV